MNANTDTSVSLLDAVRAGNDDLAWQRMFDIYQPLIAKWLRRFSAPRDDIDDLVQEVLTVIVKKIDTFERQPRVGAFRAWLRNTTRNILLQLWRKKKFQPAATGSDDFQEVLNQLGQESSELSQQWNREYDDYILKSVLQLARKEFSDQTWQAFEGVAIAGRKSREVAEELGISVNAVFIAKSRVMAHIRATGQHLLSIDDSPQDGIINLRNQ